MEKNMSLKTTLIISAALTTFLLVILAGVITGAGLANAAPQPVSNTATVAGSVDVAVLQAREQQYNQLLAEANQRLTDAYAQMTGTPAPAPATAEAAPATGNISVEQAAAIAFNAAAPGSTLLKLPELVQLEGTTVYEVTFDTGLVYVDASTGQVVFNSAAPVQLTRDHEEHEENEEHSIFGDDDD
jgi:uncharacterized membrane protein YkoI